MLDTSLMHTKYDYYHKKTKELIKKFEQKRVNR